MKKVLKLGFIILNIILIKLGFTFIINEIIIGNFNNNIYNTNLIKILYPFNFTQSYIVFYNDGNLLYKKGKYTIAIEKYKKAIDKNPPQNKICDVRINLALSMIKEIDETFDYNSAYNQLEDAKNNLYNNSCANKIDSSGYSKDAEKLEDEIKKLQDQLNSSFNDNKEQDNKDEEKKDYSDIEEELKEKEKQSNAIRQADMGTYENMGDYSYYSGKRW